MNQSTKQIKTIDKNIKKRTKWKNDKKKNKEIKTCQNKNKEY